MVGADDGNNVNTNPYVLQSSDHPHASLVSKILTDDNYSTWSKFVMMALSAKNKFGFVNNTLLQLAIEESPEKHHMWRRCNDLVLSWLLNSVDAKIASSVIYLILLLMFERVCKIGFHRATLQEFIKFIVILLLYHKVQAILSIDASGLLDFLLDINYTKYTLARVQQL